MQKIVLASNSAYRQEILKKLQLEFICTGSDIDESPYPNETAPALATRLSIAKAKAVSHQFTNHLIVGSDQVATCNSLMLGKPGNHETATQQLKTQSGQAVLFYTGLCVLNSTSGEYFTDLDCCTVYFKNLTDQQIQHYLKIDKPFDCAGSFKSEGYGIVLLSKIQGEDPNALVGLPLIKLIKLLNQCGCAIP